MDMVRGRRARGAISIVSRIQRGLHKLMLSSISRILLFKDVRKLQIEDWFMLFVFVLFTILIVFLNICADVSTNLILPEQVATLTPQDIRDRVYGSKCVLVVESMMCAVQWGTKVCLLMLYFRLTENLRQRLVVKIAAGYCALTYIVMIGLYYGYWCRPFNAFWETPTPNIQCATQTHHLIVNLVFNLTSDLLIIFIPLPMFIKAHLELKKKLLLIFPFSLGFFTMVCAILSKNLSFTQPFSVQWIYWYTREASTAMIVANMPYSWIIIRKVFRVKAFLHRAGSVTGSPGNTQEGRHVSNATATTAPDAQSWSSKHLTFFKRDKLQKQDSTTESIGPINESNAKQMTDWKDHEVDRKSDPYSTSSSEGTKSVDRKPSSGLADVDRLYRLDDEDLEMSVLQHHTARNYEP